jgi:hypothetical protein
MEVKTVKSVLGYGFNWFRKPCNRRQGETMGGARFEFVVLHNGLFIRDYRVRDIDNDHIELRAGFNNDKVTIIERVRRKRDVRRDYL